MNQLLARFLSFLRPKFLTYTLSFIIMESIVRGIANNLVHLNHWFMRNITSGHIILVHSYILVWTGLPSLQMQGGPFDIFFKNIVMEYSS